MTKIIVCSGSGIGSGKTTFCRKICDTVIGFADIIRMELQQEYPQIDFFNKSQEYKSSIVGNTGKTVRQIMVEYAEAKRKQDISYFAKRTIEIIDTLYFDKTVGVDDMRFVVELDMLKSHFEDVTHFHIFWPHAIKESHTEDKQLMCLADYVLLRRE